MDGCLVLAKEFIDSQREAGVLPLSGSMSLSHFFHFRLYFFDSRLTFLMDFIQILPFILVNFKFPDIIGELEDIVLEECFVSVSGHDFMFLRVDDPFLLFIRIFQLSNLSI